MSSPDPVRSRLPRELPLVGRGGDLEQLHTLFGDSPATEPIVILKGEGGVGKSRLARTLAAEADRRGWRVTYGRAYPVETGAPYALLSDAFLPLLREMDESTLTVLSRGNLSELRRLFPALGIADEQRGTGEDPRELRTRLYWAFTEFVQRLASREPLLVILEDLHWADASSLALLHFLGRHVSGEPVRILCTYNVDYRDEQERLIRLERSFLSLRRVRLLPLSPLTRESTQELLEKVFGASGPPVRDFADILFGWTRGNPYFLEQTLDALVSSGRLYQRDGTWLGWEARELELPSSVRDAILIRFRDLSDEAVVVAEMLSVVGSPATVPLLADVSDLPTPRVVTAVEELVHLGLVEEHVAEGSVVLQFRHPLTRETLYQRLSLTRRRVLHRRVAEALERLHGARAMERADELAYHFVQGAEGPDDARAARYLAEAGRAALRRHADREAADYLDAAVELLGPEAGDEPAPPVREPPPGEMDVSALKRELARARARLGQYGPARALWEDILTSAADPDDVARAHRHLGLIAFWTGEHEEALSRYDAAVAALGDRSPHTRARLHLASGLALQALGRSDEGRSKAEQALAIAEELEEPALLGRVHRALAMLLAFTGEAARAREHGWKAVSLADRVGDDYLAFSGRWALAYLEGMSGGPAAVVELLGECRGLAERLRSPVLRLWVTELEVEDGWFGGDWDRALAQGERGIVQAENLNQRTLMVRLMVWTATCYLGRGDLERGRELVERAWRTAGLEDGLGDGGAKELDVHAVVPAHIGRTALFLSEERYDEAIETGRAAVALADRFGYVAWVLHRLLPLVTEAEIRAGRLDDAKRSVERLRKEGTRMDHKLALAYAEAGAAVVAWHSGRIEEAAGLLRDAAEGLEAVGVIPEAARLRRQLAGRLAELGERDAALAELRDVHDTFGRLGARPELVKARHMFGEMDSRPPAWPHTAANGEGVLTAREYEVASLVAARNSNKAVAKALGISPRTVTTHLSNMYRKLEIGSRGELVDMMREGRLLRPDDQATPTD